jgi:cellulose synthase/poly-beta-1,6-N-acetylglucosamine synthase-like glycosyltransferase
MTDPQYSFNIICTSLGRDSLPRLIDSFKNQLTEKDHFTIISDLNHDKVKSTLKEYKFKFNLNYIEADDYERHGKYGHPLLNKYMNSLDGDFIMFADDDDYYTPDAFENVRKYVKEKKLYIFKHKWGHTVNWAGESFELGNIGKCLGVIPNTKNLPAFREDVFGDGYFYQDLSKMFDYEFIDKIIYKVRDTE